MSLVEVPGRRPKDESRARRPVLKKEEEMEKALRFDSLLVHGGLEPGPAGATAVPIVQSSSFAYISAEGLEDVFRGRAVGSVYSRC